MATAPELTFTQKRFIVQRLACYERPTAVAQAVKEEFGLELSRQRVAYYDPTTVNGRALDPDLKALFVKIREEFRTNLDAIPIANLAVRLRTLQRLAELAEDRKQIPVVADLLERAAKEVGGAFTNQQRHEHTGAGGKDLVPADALTDLEIARRLAFVLAKGMQAQQQNLPAPDPIPTPAKPAEIQAG